MTDRALLWLGLAGLGALALAPAAALKLARGRAIGGPEARAGSDGWVTGNPATLASQAGAGLDVYALARLIASEVGGLPELARIAVAYAALNEARRRKTTVSKLLMGSAGRFSAQNVGGKFASTAQPPTTGDLETARRVFAALVSDPTGGATRWDSPAAQRALLKRGASRYTKTPEQVAASRRGEGFEVVYLAGIDPEKLRFWRKRSSAGGLLSELLS
jgi:hypothetical protein